MKKRLFSVFAGLVVLLTFLLSAVSADAKVVAFGSRGGGGNPFNPRGYFLATKDGGKYWLSSKFSTPKYSDQYDELGHQVQYTGTEAGLDFVEAEDVVGLYAITDRNPRIYQYLACVQKKSQGDVFETVPDFIGTLKPPIRQSGAAVDPNGDQWWTIESTFSLEPGTAYEFYFLRGLEANNGISCVLAADNSGYIAEAFTKEESALYEAHKYDEYQYLTSATLDENGVWQLTFVPMRYKIQTYADVSAWTPESEAAHAFLDSITASDIAAHKYKQENVDALRELLERYDAEVSGSMKRSLQNDVDARLAQMISDTENAVNAVKNDVPVPADLEKYKETLREAKEFYAVAKEHVGAAIGQYAQIPVDNLRDVITDAENTVSDYTEQTIVDNKVFALEQAIIAVKASRVTEGEMKFYDMSTGIYVILKEGAVPPDAKLYVGQIDLNASQTAKVRENMTGPVKELVVYEILFFVGDELVTPEGSAKIQIPVLNSMKDFNTAVYFVEDDFSPTYTSSALAQGMRVFQTSSMGRFALVAFDGAVTDTEQGNPVSSDKSQKEKLDIVDRNSVVTEAQNKLEEMHETEAEGKETAQLAERNREKAPMPEFTGIELSELDRTFGEYDTVYIAAILTLTGLVAGMAEFVRERRKKEKLTV